jgi:hypothetical protein
VFHGLPDSEEDPEPKHLYAILGLAGADKVGRGSQSPPWPFVPRPFSEGVASMPRDLRILASGFSEVSSGSSVPLLEEQGARQLRDGDRVIELAHLVRSLKNPAQKSVVLVTSRLTTRTTTNGIAVAHFVQSFPRLRPRRAWVR